MRKELIFLAWAFLVAGCNSNDAPDVSNIPVDVKIERFDKFFFERTDTNNIAKSVAELQSAFPHFTTDFITNILGLPEINPASPDAGTAITLSEIKRFFNLTKPLHDSLAPRFSKTDKLKKELDQGFRYVKYYFPAYKIPEVVTYVGPFDAPAVAVTTHAIAIGLQLYAGKDFSFYTSTEGQELYPMYISRRFEPEYIPTNCMKAVVEDLFPEKGAGGALIDQMIENGKQLYLLDKFLPRSPDTLKTGYTEKELKWCKGNEGVVWNFFLKGNDLYSTEPSVIKNYIGEAPHTEGMPESAPGNIGQWVGWMIVETYAQKNPEQKAADIMRTNARKIFSESKYRPR